VAPGVEHRSSVVTAGEAKPHEHAESLLPDRPDSLDDRGGIGLGVLKRALEIVDHGQPLPGHLRPRLVRGAPDLDGTPLAQVVQVGEGPQAQILSLGQAALQVGDGAVAAPAAAGPFRAGPGVPLGLRPAAAPAAGPGLGPSGCVTHGW